MARLRLLTLITFFKTCDGFLFTVAAFFAALPAFFIALVCFALVSLFFRRVGVCPPVATASVLYLFYTYMHNVLHLMIGFMCHKTWTYFGALLMVQK